MNRSDGMSTWHSTEVSSSARPADGGHPEGASGAWGIHRGLMVALALLVLVLLAGCERTHSQQWGYRGTAAVQLRAPAVVANAPTVNAIPEPEFQDPPDPEAPALSEVHTNVQVLNDLTVLEFSRLMQAMSTWIAPEEGCEFCHNVEQMASDEKYPKVVARRMLQMTRDINTKWKTHVGEVGVTCWTCHRGQAVPSGDWFAKPSGAHEKNLMGNRANQNAAGMPSSGNSSLPNDALSAFLDRDTPVRIQGNTALKVAAHDSIKQTEWTYSLMMYMSNSLGVNCTYCHSSRALANWNESTPQRATAWYGLRMVRDLNNAYLTPLTPIFPAHRLSPEGDGPKVGCETCHKGWYKPLNGVSMLPDYPELGGPMVRPPADAASGPAASAAAPAPTDPKTRVATATN